MLRPRKDAAYPLAPFPWLARPVVFAFVFLLFSYIFHSNCSFPSTFPLSQICLTLERSRPPRDVSQTKHNKLQKQTMNQRQRLLPLVVILEEH